MHRTSACAYVEVYVILIHNYSITFSINGISAIESTEIDYKRYGTNM